MTKTTNDSQWPLVLLSLISNNQCWQTLKLNELNITITNGIDQFDHYVGAFLHYNQKEALLIASKTCGRISISIVLSMERCRLRNNVLDERPIQSESSVLLSYCPRYGKYYSIHRSSTESCISIV